MDITKFKTRMRLKSRRQTSQIATLPDVVSDLEAISAEMDAGVKLTSSARGIVVTGGETEIFSVDRLGPSFVDKVAVANPNTGTMRVRKIAGDASFVSYLEAAFPIANGKHIVHRIGKEAADGFVRHYSAYISTKTMVDDVVLSAAVDSEPSVTNLAAPVGAEWTNATGNNPYTLVVGTSMAFTFTGTGLNLRLYCDNRGGGWRVLVDGVDRGIISVYESVGAWYTRVVCRGLSESTHSVVMTFVGPDGVNTPIAGGPRGWISRANQATPTGADLRGYAMVQAAHLREAYPVEHQLSAPGSNMEAAITWRKVGAVYAATWWPWHGTAGPTAILAQTVYVDGVWMDMSATLTDWVTASRIDIAQTFSAQHPSEPATKLANGVMTSSLTASGYAYKLSLDLTADVEVTFAYGTMCAAYNCNRIEWNTDVSQDTSAHNDSMLGPTARISDSGWLSDAAHPYVWAFDIIDWKKTMRVGRIGSRPAFNFVQTRSDGTRFTKAYNYISLGTPAVTWPSGERLEISGRFRGGFRPSN